MDNLLLSPVSPLYYSVANNAGIGQSPYPYSLYNKSAEKTISLPKFMCHGQSRTPVPTVFDYPNILMETLVMPWIFSLIKDS